MYTRPAIGRLPRECRYGTRESPLLSRELTSRTRICAVRNDVSVPTLFFPSPAGSEGACMHVGACLPAPRRRRSKKIVDSTNVLSLSPEGEPTTPRGMDWRPPSLPTRRPDTRCRGRPFQDWVRSVMYFRQDRLLSFSGPTCSGASSRRASTGHSGASRPGCHSVAFYHQRIGKLGPDSEERSPDLTREFRHECLPSLSLHCTTPHDYTAVLCAPSRHYEPPFLGVGKLAPNPIIIGSNGRGYAPERSETP